jgi:hypothetical protein
LTANGEHYDFALERDYMPAYARAWDPMRMTLITPDVAERVRFRNAVLIIHAWSQYYVNLLVDSQAQLRAVMTDIERNAQGSD